MKPIAIVQARMSSSRLPGKVLQDLAGRTVLEYVVHRCRLSRRLTDVVVATTDEPIDDPICALAQSAGIRVFRGSRDDVLDRFVHAALAVGADPIIRITSDCPLIEPSIIDQVVECFEQSGAEFIYTDGFPRGSGDSELVTLSALQRAWQKTTPDETYYREHVITYHWRNPALFRQHVLTAPKEISDLNYRLCVDEADDLWVIRQICSHFAPRIDFDLVEIVTFLGEHPEVAGVNRHVVQKQT
jgi:spore coat polysaccharide biosynthesis protein SpsF